MRNLPLIGFLSRCCHGFPLFFGGGGAAPAPVAPPEPAPVAASMRADSSGAKRAVKGQAKRRIGGQDAISGDILGSMSQRPGMTSTLGGNAKAYTGEA